MAPSILVAGIMGRLASMPIAYWLLWLLSLGSSIALVVLLRTRWGESRPLQKCAVLSLLVHLMLAWVAMTVRIVAGDGDGNGGGMGPAIRVRVVENAVDEGQPHASMLAEAVPIEDAPKLLELPPEEKPAAPSAEEKQAEAEPPADDPPESKLVVGESKQPPAVPSAAPDPAPQNPAEPADAKVAEAPQPVEPIATAVAPPPAEALPSAEPHPTADVAPVIEAVTPVAGVRRVALPIAATPYAYRDAPGRLGLVEQQGGNGQTESSVSSALRWLASVQSRDGRWDADETGAGQEHMVLGQNRGGAGRGADTGITALALLAFLGSGHSHLHGDYQETVRGGIDFLLRSQADDGSIFGDATLYAQMYCHAMATFALAEAQAMTGDKRLEPAVEKAINFSVAAQNDSVGGWRYRPGDTGDTSQLGWQLMALASARRAGISIPDNTWQRVERFLHSVRRGNSGGLASYRPDSPASTSMTAEALYCRLLMEDIFGTMLDDAAGEEATANLLASLPNAERVNLYYWYYASLALHHRHPQNDRTTEAWHTWNDAMTEAIVSTQVTEGEHAGSWGANTIWGGYGGRVYTTAMATMCLEVYYRYAPVPGRSEWTVTRPDSASRHE